MRDSSQKITWWLNYVSQFCFEVHHKPGDSCEMLVPDILSRMMMGGQKDEEEERALRLERPVLHLFKGAMSPMVLCVKIRRGRL